MDTVYIETTVIGNIAGRMHPDPVVSARQQITRNWWSNAPQRYRLFTSQVTLDECGDGDADAAAERLEITRHVELLDTTDEAKALARALMNRGAVPTSQPRDALHISIAAVHRIEFIVTWNFKHILNPHLQTKIADTCRDEEGVETDRVAPGVETGTQLVLTSWGTLGRLVPCRDAQE